MVRAEDAGLWFDHFDGLKRQSLSQSSCGSDTGTEHHFSYSPNPLRVIIIVNNNAITAATLHLIFSGKVEHVVPQRGADVASCQWHLSILTHDDTSCF